MPIIVRPAAAADIDDAYLWYEQRRPGLGAEFLAALEAGKSAIAQGSSVFQLVHRNTRRILLKRFPYAIYYRVYGDVIVIVACMHGRRDPRRWKSR